MTDRLVGESEAAKIAESARGFFFSLSLLLRPNTLKYLALHKYMPPQNLF